MDHRRTIGFGNFNGVIGRPGINNNNLVSQSRNDLENFTNSACLV